MTGVILRTIIPINSWRSNPAEHEPQIDPPAIIGKYKSQSENEQYSDQSLKSLHVSQLISEDKGINE